MEKSGAIRRPRFLLLVAAAFWVWILYFRTSLVLTGVAMEHAVSSAPGYGYQSPGGDDDVPCRGRYVYMHELPPRFNAEMLRGCGNTDGRWPDMCEQLSNAGLGQPLGAATESQKKGDDVGLTAAGGWYATHQFALDAIFHGRMRRHRCLTNDSSKAAAVFVPFYAGFDFVRHHWGYDDAARDAASRDLARWLVRRPEWRRAGGRDHFLVAGRTAWDFRRDTNLNTNWGTNLLLLEAAKNMTVLVVESSAPGHGNDIAVPYPTYFHPRADADVLDWQHKLRNADRPWLMSFVGAPRPGDQRSIRSQIIAQCGAASSACQQLGCAFGASQCHTPAAIMRLFESSVFCLQPPGDSYTRRSAFDAMVAGCVPVFFHPASAYLQYTWHLPRDHTRYSVYIPEDEVRAGTVSIEETLKRIPPAAVRRMQEEVVRLVPRLVYADPRYTMETVKDAFDVAVDAVVDKVAEERTGQSEGGEIRWSSWVHKIWSN
ncbi:xyloglucan galactosyltransferase KATAMARI1 homolog [Brachypodium distachyon]|uniref:xyloglucan galactosyltransferase KATAMARI1 homolog n=1 Tax=Brachypodium distachyon TaxID=15368 RepID=UPI0001D43834|nr:xyloglucan galactosyltransferase KATAMARI1 homolog [Brachypodium distachyon]|eukprot:XP_010236604.1 xyloglucan galactosyltransferase KATAMARI1 homolog [Brachypodium distachyon]